MKLKTSFLSQAAWLLLTFVAVPSLVALPDQVCYPLSTGIVCINDTLGSGAVDGNNYPSSLFFNGNTKLLTIERTGLSDLTTVLGLNSTSQCANPANRIYNVSLVNGELTLLCGTDETTAGTGVSNSSYACASADSYVYNVSMINGALTGICAADTDTDTNNYVTSIAFDVSGVTKTLNLSRSGLADLSAGFSTKLNEVDSPNASKVLVMGGNTIEWRFTNPVGGMLWNMTAAWSGHVLEVVDAGTGGGAAGDHLLHIQSSRANVIPAHFMQSADNIGLKVEGVSQLIGRLNVTSNITTPEICLAGTCRTSWPVDTNDSTVVSFHTSQIAGLYTNDTLRLLATDQRYNESLAVSGVNTTVNFHTSQIAGLYTNDSNIVTARNTADNNLQSNISSVNTTVAFHTSQLAGFYTNLTSESSARASADNNLQTNITSVNSTANSKASPGGCPSGQYVNQTTTSGVLCQADQVGAAAGDGTGGWFNTTTYTTTTLNVNATANLSVGSGSSLLRIHSEGSDVVFNTSTNAAKFTELCLVGDCITAWPAGEPGAGDGSGGWFNTTAYTTTTLKVNITDVLRVGDITLPNASSGVDRVSIGLADEDTGIYRIDYNRLDFAAGGNHIFGISSKGYMVINGVYTNSTFAVNGSANVTQIQIMSLTSSTCDVKAYSNGTVYCGTDDTGSTADNNLMANISAINTTVTFHTSQIAGLDTNITNEIANRKTADNNLQLNITAVNTTVAFHTTQIASAYTNITFHNTQIASAYTNITFHNTQIASAYNNITGLNTSKMNVSYPRVTGNMTFTGNTRICLEPTCVAFICFNGSHTLVANNVSVTGC